MRTMLEVCQMRGTRARLALSPAQQRQVVCGGMEREKESQRSGVAVMTAAGRKNITAAFFSPIAAGTHIFNANVLHPPRSIDNTNATAITGFHFYIPQLRLYSPLLAR